MEYDFMKARQGDVFECYGERYSVINYDKRNAFAVRLGCSFLRRKIGIRVFPYEELQKEKYELINIR